MENCCESIVKYFIFIFNFLLAVSGLALIGVGAYVQIQADNFLIFLGDNYVNTPIFLIIVGVVIFAVSFFGCCGALCENRCMIYTYSILLAVIIIAEIGTGIAGYILKDQLKAKLTNNMKEGLKNYNETSLDGVTWDLVQADLHCCGVEGPTDWQTTPDSCCVGGAVTGCGKNSSVKKYQTGCLSLLDSKFIENIYIVAGAAIGVAFVQFLGVIFACCIGKSISRSNYEEVKYI